MSAVDAVLRLVARTLPAGVRDRYREEWRADAEGAAELGLTPLSVLAGALAVALTLDRADPTVSGMPATVLAWRRARWMAAFVASALVLAFAAAGYGAGRVVEIATIACGLLAVVWMVECIRALARGRIGRRRVAVIAGIAAAAPALLLLLAAFVPILGVLSFAGLGLGALVFAVVTADDRPAARGPVPRRRRLAIAIPFAMLVWGIVATGVLDILVWNPLAKLPGMTLDEIYAGLAAAGESPGVPMVVAWAVIWSLAGIALIVVASVSGPVAALLTVKRIVSLCVAVVATTLMFEWVAGVSIAVGMADTFATSGGPASWQSVALIFLGFASTLAAIFVVLAPGPLAADASQPSAGSATAGTLP